MTAVGYLDGKRLSLALLAGARYVEARSERLNRINVFPVPDGDTGTNVSSTLLRIATGIARLQQPHVRETARAIADEALSGARGNSGAILAQFFIGFSEALPDAPRITTREFGRGVVGAADSAWSAIARPVEGTILSVIREWAGHIARRSEQLPDFAPLLDESLDRAQRALEETPRQLKQLASAGVVDAGAQAFVYLIEGIVKELREKGAEPPTPRGYPRDAETSLPALPLSDSPFLFRYCTEALVQGDAIDRELIRREAALLGDSIVVAGSSSKTRVHVHTNEPDRLFEALRKHVEVLQTKVEDMEAQHRTRVDPDRGTRVGIVTDSTCDLPPSMLEEYGVGVVPGRVIFGSENYLDKVTITPAEFYARFGKTEVVPTTSQPPPADYTQVYSNVAVHAGSIVSIHVSAALSGIYQASLIGARPVPNTAFAHVDSRTVSVGLGLVVREAAEAAAGGKPVEEVARVAEEAAGRVRLFIAVPTLQHLIRSGRVSSARGAIAGLLGVLPVLTMTEDGRVVRAGISRSFDGALRKMMDLLFHEVERSGDRSPKLGVAHCAAPALADQLASQLRERYAGSDVMIAECGPAIGAHAGPGAVGVAVLTGSNRKRQDLSGEGW